MRDKLLMRIELWRNSLGRHLHDEASRDLHDLVNALHAQMTQTLREASNATPRYRKQARKHLSELDLSPDVGGTRNTS